MKSDAVKKNAFWILAGVAPFLTFLTFLLIFLFVGGEVSTKSEAIDKELTALGNKKAKGTKPLATMDKQKDVIAQQKQKLWEANWDQQLKLFTWPNNPALKAFEAKYQKFGEKMQVVNDELATFKDKTVYEGSYDRMAGTIKPTVFAGNDWHRVLRHVSDWTERVPTQPQVWLALEDMWVQRGLLAPVSTVNASASVFVAQDDGKDPLKRKFRSRVWDLDLEVAKDGKNAGKILLAKLTNRTDRMQLLGNGKTMLLKVSLSEGGNPIDFKIEGAFLRANEVLPVKPVENLHGIPVGTEVTKLTRVEQVLDARTVPIRRIDVVQLGKVDARHAPAALKQPKFFPEEVAVETATPGGSAPGSEGGSMSSAGGPPPGIGPKGMGGVGVGAGAAANFGTPAVVLDANKKRYLDVTDQVRRMPVAMVMVVDQMYLQDTLVAFANSPLRLQVTQYHWKRFRGTLGNATDGATGGGNDGELSGGPGSTFSPSGFPGSSAGGPPNGFPGSSAGGPPGGFPGSSAGGPPGGFAGSKSGARGSSGFSVPLGSGFSSGGDSGGFGSLGGASSSGAVVAEAQATAGLVELTVYGIVTLYEKYDAKGTDGTTPPASAATPTPAAKPTITPPGRE